MKTVVTRPAASTNRVTALLILAACLSAPNGASARGGQGATSGYDITAAAGWQSPDWGGRPSITPAAGSGFTLSLPAGRSWAAVTQSVPLDLDVTPILAIRVASLTPGASGVLKLDNAPYDPAHPHDVVAQPAEFQNPGLFLADLRELGGWAGQQKIEIRLFVTGPPGAQVTYRRVEVIAPPAPDRAPIKACEPEVVGAPSARPIQLWSGPWSLTAWPGGRRLVVRRPGACGTVVVSLPGGDRTVATAGKSQPEAETLTADSTSDWAHYHTEVTVYRDIGLFHWTVDAELTQAHSLESSPPECRYALAPELAAHGAAVPGGGTLADIPTEAVSVLSAHRFGQMGMETGQAFLPSDAAIGGTALYVENYTALNQTFQLTHSSASSAVKATPAGFGYAPTTGSSTTLPAGTKVRLIDSFLALTRDNATDGLGQARTYLQLIARIYDHMNVPPTVYTDWEDVARRTLADLQSPECWTNPAKGYLRNYVNEPLSPDYAELMVQVDPLVAAMMYGSAAKTPSSIPQRIDATLHEFYLPQIRCIRDYNTEQNPKKMDSWYRIYPLIQLARAAALGDEPARQLVQESLQAAIAFAHQCGYEFPVFYNPQTLGSFQYSEPDCAGAYAYLMLQAADLFHDPSYVQEARAAVAKMASHGMNLAYELHLTALSAAACARLWQRTGDRSYLDLSLVPLANVIRRCWLWEPAYGNLQGDHLFFALSAMPGAYLAPFEECQAWMALSEYETIAHGNLPPEAEEMVSEFLKYGQTVLRYTLPPFMPPDSVAATNDRGHPNDRSLYIPVEDVNDGWALSGKIGQELYGCGGPLILAAAMTRVPDAHLTVWSDYPVRSAQWNAASRSLQVELGGVASHEGLLAVRYDPALTGWAGGLKVTTLPAAPVKNRKDSVGMILIRVAGDARVTVEPTALEPVTPKPAAP